MKGGWVGGAGQAKWRAAKQIGFGNIVGHEYPRALEPILPAVCVKNILFYFIYFCFWGCGVKHAFCLLDCRCLKSLHNRGEPLLLVNRPISIF